MATHGISWLGGFPLLLLALAPAAAQTPVLIVSGLSEPDSFGADADAVGDWDGDGIGDVAVGIPAPVFGGLPPGFVQVFSGHDGSLLAEFSGTIDKQRFGALVAGIGDADADGAVDLAVASQPMFGSAPTSLQVFSGATGALLFEKDVPIGTLYALDGAGDVNADGHADVVKGGFGCTGSGSSSDPGDATVYSGASGAVLHFWCGDGFGDHFGQEVVGGGDVNDDGYGDILVGAPELDEFTATGNGYVRVLSGFDGATLHDFEGQPIYNNGFGQAVDSAGDVDGDGRPDILVGVRQEQVGGIFYGSAIVYSGQDGSLLHHIQGTLVYKQFGFEVAGPGDVDGDGLADIAVATDQIDAPGAPQLGYVVYSGADAAPLHDVPLQPSATNLSIGLRAAGDLNADGLPDLLVVTGLFSPPFFATVRVLSGAPVLFEDLGFALAGSQGTPHLQVEGVLAQGLPLTLSVTDGPPLAPIFLVIGGAATPVPFHGGTLVPTPLIVVLGLGTDAAGSLSLGTSLHDPPPSGVTIVLQGWIPDAAAPTHFAATNAVQGLTP